MGLGSQGDSGQPEHTYPRPFYDMIHINVGGNCTLLAILYGVHAHARMPGPTVTSQAWALPHNIPTGLRQIKADQGLTRDVDHAPQLVFWFLFSCNPLQSDDASASGSSSGASSAPAVSGNDDDDDDDDDDDPRTGEGEEEFIRDDINDKENEVGPSLLEYR